MSLPSDRMACFSSVPNRSLPTLVISYSSSSTQRYLISRAFLLIISEPYRLARVLCQRLHTHFRRPTWYRTARYPPSSSRNRANIKARSLVSCQFPQTQTPPPSQPLPSPSTAPVQNGSTAPKPNIVNPEWCSPSTPLTQRLSTDTRQTAPTQPRISFPAKSALNLAHPLHQLQRQRQLQEDHRLHFPLNLERGHKRHCQFKLDLSPQAHSPGQHHGSLLDSLVA